MSERGSFGLPRLLWCLQLLAVFKLTGITSAAGLSDAAGVALTPPRGWNSYDSYSWIISEEEFLQNAKLVSQKLLPYGYEYVVVDFLWYRKHVPGASVWTPGFDVVDEWGRPMPDPGRWPSTRDGQGFAPIADKVHAMGLKFGIHVMRGISGAAVIADSEILDAKGSPAGSDGRPWTARDIALNGTDCGWMKGCFMAVNASSDGGKAFIDSLYKQYASWGVDFIKHDCVFGDDFRPDEIAAVSQAITETGRPMVYSLSPGTHATPNLASTIFNLTNLYRVTSDDWDIWPHVEIHFDVARDFAAAGLIGAPGLNGGKSWPDLDMLPLGWLTDAGVDEGPHRSCNLVEDEQKTQVTLWAMAKSPFMFGGDMLNLDQWTLSLLTNPVILGIDAYSSHNIELFRSTPGKKVLQLASCQFAQKTSWGKSVLLSEDQLCWSTPASDSELIGCLNWRPSTEQEIFTASTHPITEAGQLWTSHRESSCVDSETITEASTTVELTSGPLTDCVGKPSQTWFLTSGELVNSATGQCATVVEQRDDTRVWVARGSSGEFIVAFFNIGPARTVITVPLDIVIQYLNGTKLESSLILDPSTHRPTNVDWRCQVKDGWDGNLSVVKRYISASVPSHGTVLSILLKCDQVPNDGAWQFVSANLGILIVAVIAVLALISTLSLRWWKSSAGGAFLVPASLEGGIPFMAADESWSVSSLSSS